MRILVIVPSNRESYPPEQVELRRKALLSYASPGTEIEIGFPEGGGVWVDEVTEYDHYQLCPYVAKRAKHAEDEGYDAVMVHCLDDPGVEAARSLVDIPVLGIGRLGYHFATTIADKFGVIMPTRDAIPFVHKQSKVFGVESMITSIRDVDIPLTQMTDRRDELRDRFIRVGKELIVEGAQLIMAGCLVMVPVSLSAKELEKELQVPVLDPDAIATKVAEVMVSTGLRHSRLAYPSPKSPRIF